MTKISPVDREAIEAIRGAKSVRIIIEDGRNERTEFIFNGRRAGDFRMFVRALRLAVQEYVAGCYKQVDRHERNF